MTESDGIAKEIARAARVRYLTEAEFHARVELACNVVRCVGPWDNLAAEQARTAAAIALHLTNAPLPEPQSRPEWLVEQLSPMKLDTLGLTDEQKAALFR